VQFEVGESFSETRSAPEAEGQRRERVDFVLVRRTTLVRGRVRVFHPPLGQKLRGFGEVLGDVAQYVVRENHVRLITKVELMKLSNIFLIKNLTPFGTW